MGCTRRMTGPTEIELISAHYKATHTHLWTAAVPVVHRE